MSSRSLEYSMASSSERVAPRYRRKTGIFHLAAFQRSGMQSLKDGGLNPNMADAVVKLGASKALSCRARARIVETAQKRSFLVGVKKNMVLHTVSMRDRCGGICSPERTVGYCKVDPRTPKSGKTKETSAEKAAKGVSPTIEVSFR